VSELPDWLAAVQEFGGLEDVVEVRWTTEDGESHVLQQTEAALPDRKLFGDDPRRVREATFVFGSGARVTVDFSEADCSVSGAEGG